jgi:hypothetical protein
LEKKNKTKVLFWLFPFSPIGREAIRILSKCPLRNFLPLTGWKLGGGRKFLRIPVVF